MALVNEKKRESVHTGMDLFVVPAMQTTVQDGMLVEHQPLAILAPTLPVKFAIRANKLCALCAWNESCIYGTPGSLGGYR